MAPAAPQKTIMVVDDDVDFLNQMKLLLAAEGFDVVTAGSRAEAEKMLESIEPDLAIIDLMMEHSDSGFVLAHTIKRRNASTPVILVTAVTSQTGLEFPVAQGDPSSWVMADVVLDKPVRFEQVQREIGRLLKD